MRRQKQETMTRNTGYVGTWDPTGRILYLDGKKYVVNHNLNTVCLPLNKKDIEYLKSIKSPELR